MNSNKVLVIADDVQLDRFIIKNIFKDEYTIHEASNGKEALELLKSLPNVDALILDLYMPEMTGFEVLDEIKKDEKLNFIPVIVVTSVSEEEIQIKALNAGAVDVMTKPINPSITWHKLANIISRRESEIQRIKNAEIQTTLRLLRRDPISGISNKYAFKTDVRVAMQSHPEEKYIIMRWDVDNFKSYNDMFGMNKGDQYIRHIGNFYLMRENEKGLIAAARYENEHFVCCYLESEFSVEAEMEKVINYLEMIKEGNVVLQPRFGLLKVEDNSLDVALQCDNVLLALRSTKENFDKKYAWYNEAVRVAMLEESEIVNQMKGALENREFVIFLQPQFDYGTSELIGAEVLARWKHPTKGMMSPEKFITIFEKNGFISKLDYYIWEEAFRLLRRWLDEGRTPVKLAVNISPCDFYNLNIYSTFKELLERYSVPSELIHVEITETACVQNSENVLDTLEKLREIGIKIHLDDFGTGYSSLNILNSLPFDLIKLDRSFLQEDFSKASNVGFMKAIVDFSTSLNIPLLIEGVEHEAQAKFMLELGCSEMQGYLFSKPLIVEEFENTFC